MIDNNLNGFRSFIEDYLTEDDPRFTKYTILDKIMYMSYMFINVAANMCNSDYTKEIVGYITKWCDERLYMFDNIIDLEHFENYPGDERNWNMMVGDNIFTYGISPFIDPDDNDIDSYINITLETNGSVVIKLDYADEDTITLYKDDCFSLKEATCGVISNVISLLKAVELACIKMQVIRSKDPSFKWDPYSINLDDKFFEFIREILFTEEGNGKLYSSIYNIKESKYLDLLDELMKEMKFYPFEYSQEYIEGQSAEGLISTIEHMDIVTNISDEPINHGALILSEDVRKSIMRIIKDNTYKFVVSTVSVGDSATKSTIDKVFPYMFVLSDYKAMRISDIDEESSVKEDANFVYSWMVENLKSMDIDMDDISIGEDNIASLNSAIIKKLNNITYNGPDEDDENDEDDEDDLIPSQDPREAIFKPMDIDEPVEESKCEVVKYDGNWKEEPEVMDQSRRLELMLAMSDKIRSSYMNMLYCQMKLENGDLKVLAELMHDMTKEDYGGFYSKFKVSNDVDIRDMFSNDSMLLNIIANGKVIDAILFECVDTGHWNACRIYDKISTSNHQFKNMYYKNCGIDSKIKLGFTLSSCAGRMTYEMNEELSFMGKKELDNIDISMMSYDITMYILSGMTNAFMQEFISRQKDPIAHMVQNYSGFKLKMRTFNASEFLDGVETILDKNSLNKEDLSNLQKLCEMECDDEFDAFDNSALNNQDSSIVITFFDGRIGRAGSDGLFISKNGKLGYKELFRKGSPLIITKNNDPIIIVENTDKPRSDTHKIIGNIFKYYSTR